jgi:phosphoenolpyruvate carboxykinase (ATP)
LFNIEIPTSCPGVPSELLMPKNTWEDKEAYDKTAKDLAAHFVENFKKYDTMPQEIIDAGPNVK